MSEPVCGCGASVAVYLEALRRLVRDCIADYRPQALDETTVDAATLVLWWHGVREGEPHVRALLQEPRPPLCRAYWADRIWPPPSDLDLEADLLAWLREQEALAC
jgi:hypothetical protein